MASHREPKQIAMTFQESLGIIGWSADGTHLYFSEPSDTSVAVNRVDVATGESGNESNGREGTTQRASIGLSDIGWCARDDRPCGPGPAKCDTVDTRTDAGWNWMEDV